MATSEQAAPDPLADPRVFQALQEYQSEVDAGRRADRAEFVARYPDVAEALAGCLRGLDFLRAAAPRVTHAGAPGVAAPVFTTESRLGDFRILREVGRGGMGVVYEAEQLSLGRRVALKVLAVPAPDDRARQRFRNEAHAVAALTHPHIVPVHAIGAEGDALFLAMRFVKGRSLAALIRQVQGSSDLSKAPTRQPAETATDAPAPDAPVTAGEPLPFAPPPASEYYRTVARFTAAAAEALQHAHDCGIVHRDIKPGNLLLEPDGHLWVADFGLARLPGAGDLTRTGEMLGTLRYMSPEQAGGTTLDHRTDVYSLGVTLYEVVALRAAFPGADPHDVLRRVAAEEPPAPRALAPAVPRDLETIILKAIAKEPAERYATAQAFADDLTRFLKDRPVLAQRPTLARRARKWAKRNRVLVTSAAGVSLLFLASAVVGLAVSRDHIRAEQQLTDKANSELKDKYTELAETVGVRDRAISDRDKANADLTVALRQARRAEYTYKFLAARREWQVGNIARANELLNQCPEEFRRWEWSYQKNLCQPGLLTLNTNSGLPSQVVLTSDGSRLALVQIGPGRVWDLGFGAGASERFTFSRARVIAFAPDGSRLYVGSRDQKLRTLDGATGAELAAATLPEPAAAFSANGDRLVCAGKSGVHLVSVPDGKPIPGFRYAQPASGARVECLSSVIVLAEKAGGIELIDPDTGKSVGELTTTQREAAIAASPNNRLLAVQTEQQFVTIWDLTTRKPLHTLRGHAGDVRGLAFAPDGRRLASVGADRTVRVWDAAAGKELFIFRGHDADIHHAAFSPDGLRLATTDTSGKVVVWDATAGQESRSLPAPTGLTVGAGSANAGDLVVRPGIATRPAQGTYARTLHLVTNEEKVTYLAPGTHGAIPVEGGRGAFLTLSSSDQQGEWMFWDRPDGQAKALVGLKGMLYPAVLSPDGSTLVAADSRSGVIQVVDVATAKLRYTLTKHAPVDKSVLPRGELLPYPSNVFYADPLPVNALAFHPRGHQFASVGQYGKMHVWDTQTGACLRTFRDQKGPVTGVAYDPTGKWLASTGDRTRIYNADTGALQLTLRGGEGKWQSAVTFTPDGSRLVTGDAGSVRFWDPVTGEDYLSIPNPIMLRSLSFSPDGRYLIGSEAQGGVRVWDGGETTHGTRAARVTGGAKSWYADRATEAEKQEDWFAAAWYLNRLVARDPQNAALKERLEKVMAALNAARPKP